MMRSIFKASRLSHRLFSTKDGARVAIVGSGPSGFYTAKYLLKASEKDKGIPVKEITMIDRLPVPFGLVRFGVAPDHPEVKNVVDDFTIVASDPRFHFMGNVELREPSDTSSLSSRSSPLTPHVTLKELRNEFDAIVLSYGAEDDRKLNIEGEHLEGVISARAFVNWYNGHPEYAHLSNDIKHALERNPNVLVIGQGNVALDCARILAKAGTCKSSQVEPTSGLHLTDITSESLKTLKEIRDNGVGVQKVSVIGRRGAAQASFTIKELRELTKIDEVKFTVNNEELALSESAASNEEIKANRPKQRLTALIKKVAEEPPMTEGQDCGVDLRFLLSPHKIKADGSGKHVGSMTFHRSELQGPAGEQRALVRSDLDPIELEAGLVLSAVGWKSLQCDPSLPFDDKKCVIPTNNSRVIIGDEEGENEDGGGRGGASLYAAGWIRRGPTGIIGSNIGDAREAASAVLQDFESKAELSSVGSVGGYEAMKSLVSSRGALVDWTDWKLMDDLEVATGVKKGKSREKLASVEEMLKVARSS